jgi:hypothetical protein
MKPTRARAILKLTQSELSKLRPCDGDFVDVDDDGYWAYTAIGLCNGDAGSHVIHETSQGAFREALKGIRPCAEDCPRCFPSNVSFGYRHPEA